MTTSKHAGTALWAGAVALAATGLWILTGPGHEADTTGPPVAGATATTQTAPPQPSSELGAAVPRQLPAGAGRRPGIGGEAAADATSEPQETTEDAPTAATAPSVERFTPLAEGDNPVWVADWIPYSDDGGQDSSASTQEPTDQAELMQLQNTFVRTVPATMPGSDEAITAARAALDLDLEQAGMGKPDHVAAVVITPQPVPAANIALHDLEQLDVGLYVTLETDLKTTEPRIYRVSLVRAGDTWAKNKIRLN